jgi:hypothetical protein
LSFLCPTSPLSLEADHKKQHGAEGDMVSKFGERVKKLPDEQRIRFYEILARELTIGIRYICSISISPEEKVDQLKWINEIMHRVIAKIYCERTKSHEWSDTDFEDMVRDWVSNNLEVEDVLNNAINYSYKYTTESL